MSAVMKRTYRKIEPMHLGYAKGRFECYASTSAVRAEIKERWGVEYPSQALHYYWTKANKRPDHGASLYATSAEARGAARLAVSDSDPGDES